jgi:hypothetical protein
VNHPAQVVAHHAEERPVRSLPPIRAFALGD